jgi:hypothetical protein
MAHSMYRVLLFSTIPWMTILWSLKILDNKAPYILSIIVACILALVYQCHIYPVYATPFKALPSLKVNQVFPKYSQYNRRKSNIFDED